MAGPQRLDAPLRPVQKPIDIAALGVGGHLGRDRGGEPDERSGQRPSHSEGAFEGREANLHLRPLPTSGSPFAVLNLRT